MADEGIDRDTFYQEMLSLDSSYSSQKFYNRVYGSPAETYEEGFELKPNHIVAGFDGPVVKDGDEYYTEYNDECAVQIELKLEDEFGEKAPKRFLLGGKNKSGKTILSEIFARGLQRTYHMPRFGIDIYGEYYAKRKKFAYDKGPAYQAQMEDLSRHYGFELEGLNLYIISPKFLGKQPNVDKAYCLGYDQVRNLIELNRLAMDILAEILGIHNNEENLNFLERAMSDPTVHSWKGLIKKLHELQEKFEQYRNLNKVISAIDSRLESSAPVLSDSPKDWINLLQLLKEYDMVAFKGQVRSSIDDTREMRKYNGMLKLCLLEIAVDLTRWLDSHDEGSVLKSNNGIIIHADELPNIIPSNGQSSLKGDFIRLGTFWRKALMHVIGSVQSIEQIDSAFVEQVDYYVMTRVEQENKQALKNSNISQKLIEGIFSRLHWGIITNVRTKVNEFFMIDKNRNYQVTTFCPIWPECSFVKRE